MRLAIIPKVVLVALPLAVASIANTQVISPIPAGGTNTVTVITTHATAGDTIAIFAAAPPVGAAAPVCNAAVGKPLPLVTGTSNLVLAAASTTLVLQHSLAKGQLICVVITSAAAAPPAGSPWTTLQVTVARPTKDPCALDYNDCYWSYQLVGGVEQSDLSAQDSQTEGFVDLFTRGPLNTRGYTWLEARFLGAPNNSNTQGIASAVTNPSGTVTATTLSTVGEAVDYVVGGGYRVHTSPSGKWTLDAIAGFGATTPLSSETASVAYAVPAYGTNECSLLAGRFTSAYGYNNPLPGPGVITTSTPPNPPSMSPMYCVVEQVPTTSTTTTNGVTSTTTVSGTQITDIAFAPENRTSFLLKYVVGLRYIFRTSTDGSGLCGGTKDDLIDNCARTMVDFTLGQDEEITGGKLRRLVYKTNAVFPVPKATSLYFFASASIRGKRNQEFPPLLLTQVPISTSTGAATAGSVTVPSPSVFVLPLLQSDRDFYRIGIALDLAKLLPNLFK